MQYRKKPVVVDAFKLYFDCLAKLKKWVESFGDSFEKWFQFIDQGSDGGAILVNTLEGTSYNTKPGEWIIRGVNGEYYPCKPDIFDKTYEPVNTNKSPSPKEKELREALSELVRLKNIKDSIDSGEIKDKETFKEYVVKKKEAWARATEALRQ